MIDQYKDFNYVDKMLRDLKIDHKALYTELGMSRQSWSGYKTSGKIPLEQAVNIKEWFDRYLSKEVNTNETNSDYNVIKLYDIKVSAGAGLEIDSTYDMPFERIKIDMNILPKNMSADGLVGMKVDGKSMIPTLLPNEIVIYKEEIGKFNGDALYVVNFGGMLMVKRIQFNPELNKFDVISDNPQFKSYSIDLSDNQTSLMLIGKVISTIQQ